MLSLRCSLVPARTGDLCKGREANCGKSVEDEPQGFDFRASFFRGWYL